MTTQPILALAGAAALAAHAASAHAQWTVVNLHPAGAESSSARSVHQGQQAGYATFAGAQHASLWAGTAASWVDLHPPGATASTVIVVRAGTQGGSATIAGVGRASLWTGTAASRIDLHPSSANHSEIHALDGTVQCGAVNISGHGEYASVWSSTPASWVGFGGAFWYSWIVGADGGQKVGRGDTLTPSTPFHARLWTANTPTPSIDLNPAGAFTSGAYAVHNGQQVGTGVFAGVPMAGLWNGTAASWTSLHPPGMAQSGASGVHSGVQVGVTRVEGQPFHAALWRGTPGSYLDLHAFLPPNYNESIANGIWVNGSTTYVVGSATNETLGRTEAVMWVACYPDCNSDGSLNLADFGCFQTAFALGQPYADCNGDGVRNLSDFGCFQTKFALGCP